MPEAKVKKPQDHLVKKDAPRTVSVRDIEVVVDPKAFDDFEVLDALDQINEGNGLRVAGLLRKLVGDQFHEVLDALRDGENGRVPVDAASDFLKELMEAVSPN